MQVAYLASYTQGWISENDSTRIINCAYYLLPTSRYCNNSPIQDYVHPDDQTQPTLEMTAGFKPFKYFLLLFYDWCQSLSVLLAFLIRNGYEWITTIPREGFGWIYTETQTVEVMSFSIHQISWIERKSTSLNKRRHLVNALFKFHSVFGGFVEYIIITINKMDFYPLLK